MLLISSKSEAHCSFKIVPMKKACILSLHCPDIGGISDAMTYASFAGALALIAYLRLLRSAKKALVGKTSVNHAKPDSHATKGIYFRLWMWEGSSNFGQSMITGP